MRSAAATGANATIWGLLRHTLPALLADLATGGPDGQAAKVRGRGELPRLARVADRRGSSRLVTQVRVCTARWLWKRPLDGRTHAPSVSA
ncbi:hypothetical protein [Streptomyces sp. NPDC001652]|uniref:hypothetical protein n=1 Tax=Streptomyces sp. NPDC001652 TaxID=3154393 RepID=UPI00332E1C12